MTLKPSGTLKANKSVVDRLADDMRDEQSYDEQSGKTPVAEEDGSSREALPSGDASNGARAGGSPKESKNSAKRREELLKQLKAVEDAIAKKRSKLEKL